MATHETGEYVVEDIDATSLHTHHEGDEDSDGSRRRELVSNPSSSEETDPPRDEEEAVRGEKTNKYELQDQTNLLPVRQVVVIFMGLNCALFCSLLEQTIVTTALPTLGRVFNEAAISSWVGTAYMLTSTALQPVYGRLSDIYGRKSVLLGSLVIFMLGSLACALSTSMTMLIVFRAIQGIGGGGILTLALIIISDVVSLKDRGKYQGITGGVVAAANSLGPIVGGTFTEKVTWRWCFYINLPITGVAIIVIFFLLPLKKVHGSARSKLRKLDYYGSILTLAWAVPFLIALSWGGTMYSWASAAVLAPLIIGIVLGFVFIFVEMKLVPLPLIPMYIFRNMTVAASMATSFCNGAAFYATLYYLPQYFQVVRGESPIQSAVDMLPLTFVQVFCSFCSGYLVSKTGDYKWNLMAGFFIWTIGLGLMSSINPYTSKAHIYGYQVLIGVGAGQTFQTSLIAIQASVDRKDMATATGTRNFLRMLGGTVTLAVCTAIVNNIARSMLDEVFPADVVTAVLAAPTELAVMGFDEQQIRLVREAYSRGINGCFWFSVPMAGISFFITVFFIRRVSLKREDDEQKKAEGRAWAEARKKQRRAEQTDSSATAVSAGSREEEAKAPAEKPSGPIS
ncbi:putative tetracycline efflux protein [Cutaneotrichosporon oleaginosum]|uniref:Putative tetracycline efflux protein n=1 Tax=Cutaneotrichosporon oleaginosum TaxID=879819 RepID=A0A0J0XJ28_9TREE|nr:putative tetracycline efflux protein [Cutaneotrichosporon oleaginosum]KLT41071.1 putative tetracycline efflux protein [Cutaneotrichosporon oleaginosum]TXT05794.1 hypothetical protein COLE_07114 [Cutaneotrichosporon oleaginosum]